MKIHELTFGRERYEVELALDEGESRAALCEEIRVSPGMWSYIHGRATRATAFCLDGNFPHRRALWHLARAAEGAVGMFRSANTPAGETTESWLDGVTTPTPGGLPLDPIRPGVFRNGLGACWTLRRTDMARALAGTLDTLHLSPWSSVPYGRAFNRTLNQIAFDHEQLAREDLAEVYALQQTTPNNASASDYRDNIALPQSRIIAAWLDRNAVAFNAALAESMQGHRAYWSRSESRSTDPEGRVAWLQLGLCSLAHDAGMRIDIECDYIPGWLFRKEWDSIPTTPTG